MSFSDILGTRIILGGPDPMPPRDNDNRRLMHDWQTPAEILQWIRQRKRRLHQEVAADARLWTCPEHRLTRSITLAMEKCALWHYYGVR